MLRNLFIGGFTFLLISSNVFAQSLSRNELVDIGNTIEIFLNKHDSIYSQEEETQFVHLILETDIYENINKIKVLGTQTDTLYKLLSLLMPSCFKGWRSVNCKEKIILIPYFYFQGDQVKNNFADRIYEGYYAKIPLKDLIKEYRNIIVVKWLSSNRPQKSKI